MTPYQRRTKDFYKGGLECAIGLHSGGVEACSPRNISRPKHTIRLSNTILHFGVCDYVIKVQFWICYSLANVAVGPGDSFDWIGYIKMNNCMRQSYRVNEPLYFRQSLHRTHQQGDAEIITFSPSSVRAIVSSTSFAFSFTLHFLLFYFLGREQKSFCDCSDGLKPPKPSPPGCAHCTRSWFYFAFYVLSLYHLMKRTLDRRLVIVGNISGRIKHG